MTTMEIITKPDIINNIEKQFKMLDQAIKIMKEDETDEFKVKLKYDKFKMEMKTNNKKIQSKIVSAQHYGAVTSGILLEFNKFNEQYDIIMKLRKNNNINNKNTKSRFE